MKGILLVALGGAVGSVARFKLSEVILNHTADWRFPAGTFAVNVIGCLTAGILAGLIEKHDLFTPVYAPPPFSPDSSAASPPSRPSASRRCSC